MDEASLSSSLDLYKAQLLQVEQALQAAGDNGDLLQLRSDLQEVINLTNESLLALKKSEILKSLEDQESSQQTSASSSKCLDDEYAAFQALLGDDLKDDRNEANQSKKSSESSPKGSSPKHDTSSGDHHLNIDEAPDYTEYFKDLIGGRCRVPFSYDWGGMSYYNAIITGVDKSDDADDIPKVLVMFSNPTHNSMLPCKYFLESQCRFTGDNCRFSHGYPVLLDDLEEFKEPDFSDLKIEQKCLARYEDDLWYQAMIVDLHDDNHVTVKYDTYDETAKLELKDIFPQDLHEDDSSSESENEISQPLSEDDDENDDLPVFLWRPSSISEPLGEWEAHTRGIATKLMKKMGYVYGQGLGKSGTGRVEPVPIQLLPQGKSLDKIMELKEIAGDRDMFDVIKRQKRGKNKTKISKSGKNITKEKKTPTDVFEFINKKLSGKKGDLKELIPDHHVHVNHKKQKSANEITEKDLEKRSDRNLNLQLFKTHEEMKNVEKELCKLKQSLSRNEAKDKGMAKVIRQKILDKELYLQKLQMSEQTMQKHQTKRTNHKKLTIF